MGRAGRGRAQAGPRPLPALPVQAGSLSAGCPCSHALAGTCRWLPVRCGCSGRARSAELVQGGMCRVRAAPPPRRAHSSTLPPCCCCFCGPPPAHSTCPLPSSLLLPALGIHQACSTAPLTPPAAAGWLGWLACMRLVPPRACCSCGAPAACCPCLPACSPAIWGRLGCNDAAGRVIEQAQQPHEQSCTRGVCRWRRRRGDVARRCCCCSLLSAALLHASGILGGPCNAADGSGGGAGGLQPHTSQHNSLPHACPPTTTLIPSQGSCWFGVHTHSAASPSTLPSLHPSHTPAWCSEQGLGKT